MKILAIDQSNKGQCGFAVFDNQTLLWSGIEAYRGVQTLRQRYKRFGKVFKTLLETHSPDVIVMEQVRLFHQAGINIDTITILAGLIALVVTLAPSEITVWVVNTSSWKKAVLGNGRADKQASVEYVKTVYHKDVSDDEADAICLGVYIESHVRMTTGVTCKNIVEKIM